MATSATPSVATSNKELAVVILLRRKHFNWVIAKVKSYRSEKASQPGNKPGYNAKQ